MSKKDEYFVSQRGQELLTPLAPTDHIHFSDPIRGADHSCTNVMIGVQWRSWIGVKTVTHKEYRICMRS